MYFQKNEKERTDKKISMIKMTYGEEWKILLNVGLGQGKDQSVLVCNFRRRNQEL
jgi:hypothetical protein